MYKTTTIIPFPGQQEREARLQALKDAAIARAEALPEPLKELDLAWVFEAAARRDPSINHK